MKFIKHPHAIFLTSCLFLSFSIQHGPSSKSALYRSAPCQSVEIKQGKLSLSFDFKNGYTYGNALNIVSKFAQNGYSLKMTFDSKGRPTALLPIIAEESGAIHFEYDESGINRITTDESRSGSQVFNFSNGSQIFMAESKNSRGSWSRAMFTYNSKGDPAEVKILSEENNANQKKEKKDEVSAILTFLPDKSSLDKGNAFMASMLSNYIFGFYKNNFIFSQHLPKHITVTYNVTEYDDEGKERGSKTFINELDYSYNFDGLGRPISIGVNATAMGNTLPTRTFLISYNNCK